MVRKPNSGRRSFMRKIGATGLGLSSLSIAGVADADPVICSSDISTQCSGGGGGSSITYTSEQSDLINSDDTISVTTSVDHLGTQELADGRYNHSYNLVSIASQTNKNGDKVNGLNAQLFEWDATESSINVDYAQDNDSPYVGASPGSGGSGTVESVFETLLGQAGSELSNTIGRSIPVAQLVSNMINHFDNYYEPTDRKKWEWAYSGAVHDVVSHQMDPVIRHQSSSTTSWSVRSTADGLGNKIDFISGDPPGLIGDPTDPSYSTAKIEDSDSNMLRSSTAGLEQEDFYGLPSTLSMTTKEKEKYGVREPTAEEKRLFRARGQEIVNIVERYPMTLCAHSTQF
ncbi:hypothetical protein [Haladaptatus cibarius]|uniref:hypothetical protein n=1 Tax=Haladaptatus cibarius TaxID=453847 RepID=UPI0011859286|nr:hypothetical protein [Haladaptatus cibarius]